MIKDKILKALGGFNEFNWTVEFCPPVVCVCPPSGRGFVPEIIIGSICDETGLHFIGIDFSKNCLKFV